MKSRNNLRHRGESRATVAGGFTLIPGTALLAAWWAYKQRTIRFADLRVWFACCELIAQRRASGANPKFRPGPSHVAPLTGSAHAAASAALRRLIASGILTSTDAGFAIPDRFASVATRQDERLEHALTRAPHHARLVPVPRRILRMLARSTRPVLVATVIAHLLRCLFLRAGRVSPSGLCKAMWIAQVFGVDRRNVKAARRELVAAGWLQVGAASQRFMNRWGLSIRVDLDWHDSQIPPRSDTAAPKTPPPLQNFNRLRRSENQETASAGKAGVQGPRPESHRPMFHDVQRADLQSIARLRVLFEDAVGLGFVKRCEADHLRFIAAAERALALGTSNPPGFFAAVVRRGLWQVISQRDEEVARRRFNEDRDPVASAYRAARLRGALPQRELRAGSVLPTLFASLEAYRLSGRKAVSSNHEPHSASGERYRRVQGAVVRHGS